MIILVLDALQVSTRVQPQNTGVDIDIGKNQV